MWISFVQWFQSFSSSSACNTRGTIDRMAKSNMKQWSKSMVKVNGQNNSDFLLPQCFCHFHFMEATELQSDAIPWSNGDPISLSPRGYASPNSCSLASLPTEVFAFDLIFVTVLLPGVVGSAFLFARAGIVTFCEVFQTVQRIGVQSTITTVESKTNSIHTLSYFTCLQRYLAVSRHTFFLWRLFSVDSFLFQEVDLFHYRQKVLSLFTSTNLSVFQLKVDHLLSLIPRLTEMEMLDVSTCRTVNDTVLHCVAQNCPKLKILSVFDCVKITDAGMIDIIQHCTKLQKISMSK